MPSIKSIGPSLSGVTAPSETEAEVSVGIGITLAWADGTPAVGIDAAAIVVTASGANNTITQPSGVTDATGAIGGALYEGSTDGARTITVTVGGLALTEQPVITVGDPPALTWEANIPAWTTGNLITETNFGNMLAGEALNADGLATTTDAGPNTLANINGTDLDAPYGTDVYRTSYAEGDNGDGDGGTSLFALEVENNWRRIYFCMALKFDTGYRMHATGGEKFFYPRLRGGASTLFNIGLLPGSDQTALGPEFGFYVDPQLGEPRRYQDDNGVFITKGVYQNVELEAEVNTPGNADGILRIWIDGVLAVDFDDIEYSDDPVQDTFNAIFFNGVRGGPTDSGNVPTGGQSRYYNRLSFYASTAGS